MLLLLRTPPALLWWTLLSLIYKGAFANDIVEVTATQLSKQIYTDILAFPCIRWLNATGTFGCSAKSTTIGTLVSISSENELKSFMADSNLNDVYIILIPLHVLTRPILALMRSPNSKVKGVLVIEGSSRVSAIQSHDLPCPDCGSSLIKQDWNPQGTGLMFDDYSDFPMFALFNTSTPLSESLSAIQKALNDNQSGTGYQYKLELSSFMHAAHNANDCLRRNMCKPIGNNSIYAPMFNNTRSDLDIVMVTAALDGKSLFPDLAQAATQRLASVAALLTAATAVSTVDKAGFSKNVLITLFNGEAWGHIGSRAFAKDIDTFNCEVQHQGATPSCPYIKAACAFPCIADTTFVQLGLKTSKIVNIIDVNVLNGPAQQLRVYATSPGNLPFGGFGNVPVVSDRGIPPSPALAFIDRNPKTQPYIITTLNAQALPANISTEYDDFKSLNMTTTLDTICSAARLITRGTLALSLNASLPSSTSIISNISLNCTLASSIYTCLTTGTQCPIDIANHIQQQVPRSSYASVSVYGTSSSWPALVAESILAQLVSFPVENNQPGRPCRVSKECPLDARACINKVCVPSRAFTYLSFPPGLQADRQTGSFSVSNTSLPHFVESNWDLTSVRLFVGSTMSMQIVELCVGLLVVGISIVLVRILNQLVVF